MMNENKMDVNTMEIQKSIANMLAFTQQQEDAYSKKN